MQYSNAGSEISFFKNGVCQGVAFKDLYGGRYYPAASMYTLPNQPNCLVRFNFGPELECFPDNFEGRPLPRLMVEVPYHGVVNPVENDVPPRRRISQFGGVLWFMSSFLWNRELEVAFNLLLRSYWGLGLEKSQFDVKCKAFRLGYGK